MPSSRTILDRRGIDPLDVCQDGPLLVVGIRVQAVVEEHGVSRLPRTVLELPEGDVF